MVTVASGLVAGLIATIVMTILMMVLGGDDPPPTSALWAKYVGTDPPDAYLPQGMALHFIYGIVAGGAFAVIAGALDLAVGPDAVIGSVVWGIVFAAILMIIGMAFWMRIVIAMEPNRDAMMQFGLFHLVYGIVLGLGVAFIPL